MPHKHTNLDKIAVPWPDSPGAVYMTEDQWEQFKAKLGEPCAIFWCEQADNYAEQYPARWRRYKDHYRTLTNWHLRRVADGYDFFEHPKHGPGYYKPWVIRQAEAAA